MGKEIYVGQELLKSQSGTVTGNYTKLLNEDFYKIENYDEMDPFFMSIVSDSDHWMYISSTGGLSAGRVNSESALFPYYTEDKIQESISHTGSTTVLLVENDGKTQLWQPFSDTFDGVFSIQRNLYKNIYGDKVVFEEVNEDLGVTFRYAWRTSDQHGFVRSSWLINNSADSVNIDILDGLQNVLPYGVQTKVQQEFSNLLDAYKRTELDEQTEMGIFTLTSTLTDLAEASESLKAATIWPVGFDKPTILLSSLQIDAFKNGEDVSTESDICGYRGAYMINDTVSLSSGEVKEWHMVAEVNQDASDVALLIDQVGENKNELINQILADVEIGTENIVKIIGRADGLQTTGDHLSSAHHFANVLFNTMRGGIFDTGYTINKVDLIDYICTMNKSLGDNYKVFFEELAEGITVKELLDSASKIESLDLQRLCYEYLPLTFSRRHGDPSRPWNKFSINLKKEDGSRNLNYQGNWRDIFQNWEALAYSYPEFIEGMMSKFLNSTTADGYNPYRITRQGIDWEKPEPENPWSNIGYWGDHQIIYLQRLIEVSEKFHPEAVVSMLSEKLFSYANVPYNIKDYASLIADSDDTIEFDVARDELIDQRVAAMGSDGRLILNNAGDVYHVNLTEKLLVLLLAKLSNFVAEGGIWMNTQRPEWNDANNALVGRGISVVTLNYIHRYISSSIELFKRSDARSFAITAEVKTLFSSIASALKDFQSVLETSFTGTQRKQLLDMLGQAGSDYRQGVYVNGLSGQFEELNRDEMIAFLELTQKYTAHTIAANQREDGLYHSYNLLTVNNTEAGIDYLYEMLEGQVAVLSSGALKPAQSLSVLQSLRSSRMYRQDQHSYMLYPKRDLTGFVNKNCVSVQKLVDLALVAKLVETGDTSLISKDVNNTYHFNGSFCNQKCVKESLSKLAENKVYSDLVQAESELILAVFEETFDHASFTGRSGTIFGYEGLGSIYWHMVSKLLLAAQESFLVANESDSNSAITADLAACYYDVRKGIGFNKSVEVYGAFPTDPYSHTPWGKGAKQPGMTGQVKEEVLTRLIELGLFVKDGIVEFNPVLLRSDEFASEELAFDYYDVNEEKQSIVLEVGMLAFTFCQVPVVYIQGDEPSMTVTMLDGERICINGTTCSRDLSAHLFERTGMIKQISVVTNAGL